MNVESCEMRRVESEDAVETGPPGAFYIGTYEGGHRYMVHKLPSGDYGAIALRPVHPSHTGASWEWNGDEERPTLHPSVHLPGRWHGWLTAGRMISC